MAILTLTSCLLVLTSCNDRSGSSTYYVATSDFFYSSDKGKTYGNCSGIAMECQYYPNGINYGSKYLLPILKKDTIVSHYIAYEINDRKEEA